jgi:hypothetical protein
VQTRRILGLITLAVVLLAGSRRATGTTYVFATFKGDDAAGMKLSIYTSTDSINFTLLSDTGFGGNTSYLRDPSIMKYSDGKYYVAYTDPTTASCCNPEDHFGIAVSSDLIHWTDLTTVKAGVPAVSRVWAPEWFVEGDGAIRIIANIDTGNELPDFQPYVFTAENSALTSWSGPTALGIGADYIDTYVAKLGSTYHAFIKSETTRYLEHATASSLTGPWTFVGKNDWAGWGSGLEGPAIVQLDNGQYRMYVDPQAGGVPCQTMTSSDLNTWSARASIPGAAGTTVRHGTVIRDTTGLGSNGDFTGAGGSTGGSSGAGGATGAGGASDAGLGTAADGPRNSGGAVGTGGATDAGTSPGADGSRSDATGTGGTRSSGGASSAGGATSMGGSTGAGGAASLGGAIDTGGVAPNTGGAIASAGATSAGGAAATGGSSGMGGSASSGGMAGSLTSSGAAGSPTSEAGAGCACRLAGNNAGRKLSQRAGWQGLLLFGAALVIGFHRLRRNRSARAAAPGPTH